jgi:hypothetical protein
MRVINCISIHTDVFISQSMSATSPSPFIFEFWRLEQNTKTTARFVDWVSSFVLTYSNSDLTCLPYSFLYSSYICIFILVLQSSVECTGSGCPPVGTRGHRSVLPRKVKVRVFFTTVFYCLLVSHSFCSCRSHHEYSTYVVRPHHFLFIFAHCFRFVKYKPDGCFCKWTV